MRTPIVRNFRGARALICHGADTSRATLEESLARLGLEVTLYDPSSTEPKPPAGAHDVVFFDADEGSEGLATDDVDVPLIALIGVEAPSRLARVVRKRAAAYIIKPVRSSGIYTALVVAFSEHVQRKAEAAERAALIERLGSRRYMIKAVLTIMRRDGHDEEAAFHSLRREAMRRRIPIEDVARDIVAGSQEKNHSAPETLNAKRI